ncbi:MDR family oxidoreductase [Okibacterium endophyticum]
MTSTFRAWVVDRQPEDEQSPEGDAGTTAGASLLEVTDEFLMPGDTVVSIEYTSVNYKDGLALLGKPGVVREWPLILGIDLVGTVESSESERWQAGDHVVLNGTGLGEHHHGGLAQRARVDGTHLVRVPEPLGGLRAAAIGTAGFTAMLSVLAIERHGVRPGDGPVLVTGAAGGVGSIAIAVLSRLGYNVIASSGRAETEGAYLTHLGASAIIDRAELASPGRPLQKQRWAAVLDVAGSHTLVNAIAQLERGGIATACGLAQGTDLAGTVMPFILRGVSLVGINSVEVAPDERAVVWERLARDLDVGLLDQMTSVVALADAKTAAERILAGGIRGRTVVDVNV